MIETIRRLREAHGQVVATIETSGRSDAATLHYVAKDIERAIADLEKLQAAAESFVPAFEAFVKTIEKAIGAQHV